MSKRTYEKSRQFLDWEAAALLAAEAAYGAADGSLPYSTFLKYKETSDEAYARYRKVEQARAVYEAASSKAAEAWRAMSGVMTPFEHKMAGGEFLDADRMANKAWDEWKAIEKETAT